MKQNISRRQILFHLFLVFATSFVLAHLMAVAVHWGWLWGALGEGLAEQNQFSVQQSLFSWKDRQTPPRFTVIGDGRFLRQVKEIISPEDLEDSALFSIPQLTLDEILLVLQEAPKPPAEAVIIQNNVVLWSNLKAKSPRQDLKLWHAGTQLKWGVFPYQEVKLFFSALKDWTGGSPPGQAADTYRLEQLEYLSFTNRGDLQEAFQAAIARMGGVNMLWVEDNAGIKLASNEAMAVRFRQLASEYKTEGPHGSWITFKELPQRLDVK